MGGYFAVTMFKPSYFDLKFMEIYLILLLKSFKSLLVDISYDLRNIKIN